MINWEEFDKNVNLEGLQEDVAKAETNEFGSYEEVPFGKYEVKISKMDLVQSKKGDPMVTIWFDIINGSCLGRKIFMNQLVVQGFQIHIVNDLLRNLETGEEIKFASYQQYGILLLNVYEKAVNEEYELEYSENKGFKQFKILRKFETQTSNQQQSEDIGW